MTEGSTGRPGNQVKVLDLIRRRDRDPLSPQPLDLPATDGPQFGRADDPVGGYDPEPRQSLRLFHRERREDEGNLAGRDMKAPSDGPVGGDPAFGDGGQNRQDPRLEARYSA